jgi:hypothetical protein
MIRRGLILIPLLSERLQYYLKLQKLIAHIQKIVNLILIFEMNKKEDVEKDMKLMDIESLEIFISF